MKVTRKRFKRSMICSSDNYHASHRAYLFFLKELHNKNKEELEQIADRILADSSAAPLDVKEQLSIGKRPYTKCFGRLVSLSAEQAIEFSDAIKIIWR